MPLKAIIIKYWIAISVEILHCFMYLNENKTVKLIVLRLLTNWNTLKIFYLLILKEKSFKFLNKTNL